MKNPWIKKAKLRKHLAQYIVSLYTVENDPTGSAIAPKPGALEIEWWLSMSWTIYGFVFKKNGVFVGHYPFPAGPITIRANDRFVGRFKEAAYP